MSWDTWSHAERAVFINELNRPHDGLDAGIVHRAKKWAARGIDNRGPTPNYRPLRCDWMPDNSDLCNLTVEQFHALLEAEIDALYASIEAFEERGAIRHEQYADGLTPTERAIRALQEADTVLGEHAVAKAFLRSQAPHAGIFTRESA